MSDTPRTDEFEKHCCWSYHTTGNCWDFARQLERENAALRKALGDAATSLCTISQQAGRTKELEKMSQIRGYAFSRYSAAIDAARATEANP